MSVSVKYSDLKHRISELAEIISKELAVNVFQVHLMNFTSKGNDSLIRWAIFPPKSDDYIANATAMDIIVRLNENRVHLPDSFGSYKLFQWNIEPPPVRTWWQQHLVVIVSISVVMIVLGLLASGLWFLWRRRELSLVSYKPVDSAVPEQELQPI